MRYELRMRDGRRERARDLETLLARVRDEHLEAVALDEHGGEVNSDIGYRGRPLTVYPSAASRTPVAEIKRLLWGGFE